MRQHQPTKSLFRVEGASAERPRSRSLLRYAVLVRILSLGCVLAAAGCGKSAAPPPLPPAGAAAEPDAANPRPAVPAPAPEAAPKDPAELTALLSQLTQAARKFAAERQRVPTSLDELVSAGYLARVPQVPAGQSFTISKQLEVELRAR